MRTAPLAAIAVACALLGGIAALALGKATGWLDNGSTTTVFRSAPLPQGAAAPVSAGAAGKPLAGNGFNPARIYARRSAGVVTIIAAFGSQGAQGSGFVVSPKGYILTSSHVITTAGESEGKPKPADSLVVEFQDRDRVPAKIVGFDIFDDVGLIKVDPSQHALTPVPLGNSAAVTVGAPVAAIGSPFGNENSLVVGVVSATHRSIDSLTSRYSLVDAIQTDAPINHGNSGGPLFDARGRVIGINAQINSNSGNAEGVGFAVPINSARRSMEQLIADGAVSYAYVGVETEDLTPALAKRFHYPVERGAVVTAVRPDTPADAAGLRGGSGQRHVLGTTFTPGGDVIVAINGRRIGSAEDVVRIVTELLAPGDTARFTVVRGHSRLDLRVRLAERPAASD
ncbi:MAG TPA: trypsin-like peptidase domain-containing protein [Gaiellaceae bacterium]|nr:trypsin-like peptidase domain-containing protein [Gaiellaceae bacterium]